MAVEEEPTAKTTATVDETTDDCRIVRKDQETGDDGQNISEEGQIVREGREIGDDEQNISGESENGHDWWMICREAVTHDGNRSTCGETQTDVVSDQEMATCDSDEFVWEGMVIGGESLVFERLVTVDE
jgi:hypothetical protein